MRYCFKKDEEDPYWCNYKDNLYWCNYKDKWVKLEEATRYKEDEKLIAEAREGFPAKDGVWLPDDGSLPEAFLIRITKQVAWFLTVNQMLRPGHGIMCKEYGDDADWQDVYEDPSWWETVEPDDQYQTFEIW